MKEYGVESSWTKVYKTDLRANKISLNTNFGFVKPLKFSRDGKKVLLENSKNLFWYDLEKKRSERLKVQKLPVLFRPLTSTGSLLLLDDGDSVIDPKQNKIKKLLVEFWVWVVELVVSPADLACRCLAVQKHLADFQQFCAKPESKKLPRKVIWKPLDAGQLKTNFDGAVFEDLGDAGIGAVVRNSSGEVLAALSEIIPLPSSIVALETIPARRAVLWENSSPVTNLWKIHSSNLI
ncbi:f-box protein cpr1 [Quercus suber]|uniref:F-box protein cpr1 n=1 Tax=Quercus suber TaxID=58331 RepID=A0AAW0MCX2_QUESU